MEVRVRPRQRELQRGVIDVVALDRAAALEHRTSDASSDLVLDLSAARFIDHEALLFVGAVTSFRRSQRQTTKVRLPRTPAVIDFIRAWEFPNLLSRITTPADPFTPDTRMALDGQSAHLPKYLSIAVDPTGRRIPLLLRASMAITPVHLSGDPWRDATLAKDRFLDQNLVAVLDRVLSRDDDGDRRGHLLATHVIHEAVLNAATHPRASMSFVSCKFQHDRPFQVEQKRNPRTLQVALWDDGESFSDTVLRALRQGQSITTERFGEISEEFVLNIENEIGGFQSLTLDTRVPPSDREVEPVTAAAFMLGVSSDPLRLLQTNASGQHFPVRGQGGVGLSVLRQTVIDDFGGRIRYLSGNLRMELRGGKHPSQYIFDFTRVPHQSWALKGNLMLIDLPLAELT